MGTFTFCSNGHRRIPIVAIARGRFCGYYFPRAPGHLLTLDQLVRATLTQDQLPLGTGNFDIELIATGNFGVGLGAIDTSSSTSGPTNRVAKMNPSKIDLNGPTKKNFYLWALHGGQDELYHYHLFLLPIFPTILYPRQIFRTDTHPILRQLLQ